MTLNLLRLVMILFALSTSNNVEMSRDDRIETEIHRPTTVNFQCGKLRGRVCVQKGEMKVGEDDECDCPQCSADGYTLLELVIAAFIIFLAVLGGCLVIVAIILWLGSQEAMSNNKKIFTLGGDANYYYSLLKYVLTMMLIFVMVDQLHNWKYAFLSCLVLSILSPNKPKILYFTK